MTELAVRFFSNFFLANDKFHVYGTLCLLRPTIYSSIQVLTSSK